jgi:hypothetical protein
MWVEPRVFLPVSAWARGRRTHRLVVGRVRLHVLSRGMHQPLWYEALLLDMVPGAL